MASRFRRQPPNILEIRGISRGSLVDHPRVEGVNDMLPGPSISRELNYFDSLNPSAELDSDDDESTVVGEPFGIQSPRSPSHIDDTVTASDTSQYWSAGNSFTTGNTTERSSVYSWGDDEFDVQTSRMVREMFQAIERMLFEGVLSGSTSLQHECREWMGAFPHLRILGKQIIATRDEGFESIRSGDNTPLSAATPSNIADSINDPLQESDLSDFGSLSPLFTIPRLEIRGSSVTPWRLPSHYLSSMEQESFKSSSTSDFSHLYEEVFAEDGKVEEYLAYDIREMDDEEHSRKYHVPRRRRLGFPPITPNACVRDAVLQQIFDQTWTHVISCLSEPTDTKPTPLLKLLVENQIWSHERSSHASSLHQSSNDGRKFANNQGYPYDDEVIYDRLQPPAMLDRQRVGLQVGSSFIQPQLQHRIFYPDSLGLPPSRGSYLDQPVGGNRPLPFASGRLTAPYQAADPHSLNDLIKISHLKLQTRTDRLTGDDVTNDPLQEPIGRFSSSTQFFNGSSQGLGSIPQQLSVVGHMGISSPFTPSNRNNSTKEVMFRQQSATGRKGGRGRGRRLMPLDRSKTPNIDHNDLNVTATKLLPGNLEPVVSSFVGGRVNSPPNAFQPPPTAPNPTIGSSMWISSRLPPISSQLEALPENSLSDFKKMRGKTAYTRISSAVADEKLTRGAIENLSRPNTTHTFRAENLVSKRATSVTPSNFMFGNTALKSNSPAGASYSFSSGIPYHSSSSPDNFAGLAGITGRSINFSNVPHPSSPDEAAPVIPHSSWGISSQNNFAQSRKKRPPLI